MPPHRRWWFPPSVVLSFIIFSVLLGTSLCEEESSLDRDFCGERALISSVVKKPCPINCFRPDPICGADGITYWCGFPDAACSGARVVKRGPCDSSAPGNSAAAGQALLLVHTVWHFILGFAAIFALF